MNPSDLADFANLETVWMIVKWFYVFAFGLYLVFSLVVLTQIKQMLASLNGDVDKAIIILGWIQVFLAVAALIAAIVIL